MFYLEMGPLNKFRFLFFSLVSDVCCDVFLSNSSEVQVKLTSTCHDTCVKVLFFILSLLEKIIGELFKLDRNAPTSTGTYNENSLC